MNVSPSALATGMLSSQSVLSMRMCSSHKEPSWELGDEFLIKAKVHSSGYRTEQGNAFDSTQRTLLDHGPVKVPDRITTYTE